MRITVIDCEERDNTYFVEFTCEYGNGVARWIGGRPKRGEAYCVELGFEETLKIGVNVEARPFAVPSITCGKGGVSMMVKVEDVINDQSAVCRFGDDLIFVEYEGDFFAAGTTLRVLLADLLINDKDL
jgi:hypothetical protein